MRRLWKWLRSAWREPVVITITTKRSPDWEGDAKRYRQERGWD